MVFKKSKIRQILIIIMFVIGRISPFSMIYASGEVFPFPDESITNRVYMQNIHTVLLRDQSWELSQPIIELNSGQQLELLFDDLSDRDLYFNYTLIHCNNEWKASGIAWQEYIQGFDKGEIQDISRSFNTTYDYTHYRLVFPEENMKPIISGNYAIVVYERNAPENIVLTRRFYVVEKLVEFEGRIIQSPAGISSQTSQQLQFSVIDHSAIVRNPGSELTAVVMQNERTDNIIILQKPQFISAARYDYSFTDQLLFPGGNEFRNFDIKSLRYQSEKLAGVDFRNPYYHVILKPDESREYAPYFFREDLDGAYYIDREKAVEKHREADYVYVHFTLNWTSPFNNDKIYVFGMLSDWAIYESNRMTYNPDQGCFELTMLLKQGWYDYAFAMERTNHEIDAVMLEGNHHETGNSYSVFLYYHNLSRNIDNLIGYFSVKSK